MIERILNFYLKKVHPLRYAKRIGVSMGGMDGLQEVLFGDQSHGLLQLESVSKLLMKWEAPGGQVPLTKREQKFE